jgi:dTDP-4-amino-4,6-dideoxy-D-galactose acyltransferase
VSICELLPWDTAFFGFPIARVRSACLTESLAAEIDAWCQENSIRCLYFLARPDDPATSRLAEQHGFHLVDIRMTLVAHPSASSGEVRLAEIRPARPDDIPALERISRDCYDDSRFYSDPNFPSDRVASLYETWIRQSCQGYATAVLVAEIDGLPQGYISCHLDDPARIGLLGVSAQARARGLGRALLASALEWFGSRGAGSVSVVTQGRNTASQRLYQRCGFLTRSVELWYHKWFDSAARD